jgi:hypothetical protein
MTRGMIAGSAAAWTEKQAVGRLSGRKALATGGDMMEILDLGLRTNGGSPIP